MKEFIKDNKTITGVIICVLGFLISWGVWATSCIFSQDKDQALAVGQNRVINGAVEEVKVDLKEFKKDVKDEFSKVKDKIDTNQEKTISILMRLNKGQDKMYESMEKGK